MQPAEPPNPGDPRRKNRDALAIGLAWNLAIELLAYMAVLGYGGWWLDQRYNWNGRGLFVGLILALIAWIYRVIRQTWHLLK